MTNIASLSAAELGPLYAGKQLSPVEVAELAEKGRDYLRERRRRLTWQRRLRAGVDPLVMWRLEGGRKPERRSADPRRDVTESG